MRASNTMTQYPFPAYAPSATPYPGYIPMSDVVKDHYLTQHEKHSPTSALVLHTCYIYCPKTDESTLCIEIDRLRLVYEIPNHIPDKQLIRYIERKLLLVVTLRQPTQ